MFLTFCTSIGFCVVASGAYWFCISIVQFLNEETTKPGG